MRQASRIVGAARIVPQLYTWVSINFTHGVRIAMARKAAAKKKQHPYSTPEISGLYGRPPYEYRDSTMLVVQFETDARMLRKLVPAPLTPNKNNHMFLSVADFMCSGFGRYYEAHLFTHATFQRRPVNYSIYLILDNDVAIGAGREIWGYPKKLGRLSMTLRDDVASATVERGGITLINSAVHLAEFGQPEDLSGTSEWITRKVIPNVAHNAPPDVDQLTTTTLTNGDVREIHKGGATLSFTDSPADRLSQVPIKKVLGGFYYQTDFTLGDGEVAHNYLD